MQIQQRRSKLRAGILHRHPSGRKSWQLRHRNRVRQLQCEFAGLRGFHPRIAQQFQVRCGTAVVLIHPQRHRRMLVARCQCRLPVFRVGDAQLVYPPLRVIPAHAFFLNHRGTERIGLAQVIAQHAIDQPARPRLDRGSGFHGFVDHGMRRIRAGAQLAQRHHQQRGDQAVLERITQQRIAQRRQQRILAQTAVADVLYGGAPLNRLLRQHAIEVLAFVHHGVHSIGGAFQ